MKKYGFSVLLIISQLCSVLSLESTGPAFMWSPHIDLDLQENVNYQTLSSKQLARAVMFKGSWSNIMCESKSFAQLVDVALVFVGKELRSADISGKVISEASLVHLLKDSLMKSNFSVAYPYVSAEVKEGTLESSLLEEFEDSCDHKLGVGSIAVTDSCSIEGKEFSILSDMYSVQEFVASTMEKAQKGIKGQTDLLVLCHRGFSSLKNLDHPHPEGEVFSELISSLDNSGAKYAVLYVSDPYKPVQHPSSYQIGRFLAEAPGNVSLEAVFCDGVCQIKITLLEALFVYCCCCCCFLTSHLLPGSAKSKATLAAVLALREKKRAEDASKPAEKRKVGPASASTQPLLLNPTLLLSPTLLLGVPPK